MKTFGIGAIGLALSFAIGAFGTHALRGQLPADLLSVFQTGQQYQVYGSIALMLMGIKPVAHTNDKVSAWLVGLGVLVFSGSLYALALTGIGILGAITPLGGALMIVGLSMSAWTSFGQRNGPDVH